MRGSDEFILGSTIIFPEPKSNKAEFHIALEEVVDSAKQNFGFDLELSKLQTCVNKPTDEIASTLRRSKIDSLVGGIIRASQPSLAC